MTPEEQLDEARAKEAWRLFSTDGPPAVTIAARLAREGWTPPEPMDPDVLAFREWCKSALYSAADDSMTAQAYLAGARMAREQERERAEVLVELAESLTTLDSDDNIPAIAEVARFTLAKYRGEAW
jgi:hypothetical protein